MQTGPSSERHFITLDSRVHFCEADGTYIFLDCSRNRYVCLRPDQADMFREILDAGGFCAVLKDRTLSFARFLVQAGLLAEQRAPSERLRTPANPQPTSSLLDEAPFMTVGAARAIPAMAWSIMAAWRIARQADMSVSRTAVRNWRRQTGARSSDHRTDIRQLTVAFHALTPLFFTAHDACLFRSLALIRFLALYGFSADWVFGVRFCPFLAHCWIEQDGEVLNDFLDNVSAYRPILRIPGG